MTAKSLALAAVLVLIAVSIFAIQSQKPKQDSKSGTPIAALDKEEKAKRFESAKEIQNPAGFINTEPLHLRDFIGKNIVLVDFWTYSCINCQRTLPYLKAWHEKYKDRGLVIVGVHTPEFQFEQKYENVLAAVQKFDIRYPVILDNAYATWNAYKNQYWPRKYLIDIDGFIVYDHIGEGGYEETEKKIQELLRERAQRLGLDVSLKDDMAEVRATTPKSGTVQSPEIYFGASRNQYLANGKPGTLGVQDFSFPKEFASNALYLGGSWDIREEYAESKMSKASIIFRYRAKDVYMVASSRNGVRAKILRDGVVVATAGEDVKDGFVVVREDRLYKLIQDAAAGEHILEIIIEGSGLKAFTLTFG